MEEKEKIKYDPKKSYTWEKTDIFYLNGEEFGVALNSVRTAASSPLVQGLLLSASILEQTLARSVESGIAKEMKEEEPQPKQPDMSRKPLVKTKNGGKVKK